MIFAEATGAQIGGIVAGVVLGLPAAAYAALRVVRRDQVEDAAIRTMRRTMESLEEDRDYWRGQAQTERDAAAAVEKRLQDRLDWEKAHAARERATLEREVEALRRELQPYLLKGNP